MKKHPNFGGAFSLILPPFPAVVSICDNYVRPSLCRKDC